MRSSRRRTSTTIAALVTILATALGATVVAAPAYAAYEYFGVTDGTSGTWPDRVLAQFTVGQFYSDSLQVPAGWGPYSDLSYDSLPDGLSASLVSNGVIVINGSPTTADPSASFSFSVAGSDGASFSISFSEVVIQAATAPTTTAVATPDVSPYGAVSFQATVTGDNPTGSVDFVLNGSVVATEPLVAGVATYTGAVSSSYAGASWPLTAEYSGDADNSGSTSLQDAVFIYASASVSGTVHENDGVLEATVELLDMDSTVVASTLAVGGAYTLSVPAPSTVGQASATYYIRATYGTTVLYYSHSGGVGQPNVTIPAFATITGPATWTGPRDIYHNVAPVWADAILAQPRLGTPYSDGVTASGTATISYSVLGSLPAGLSLNTATGAITGTPTDQISSSFLIRAVNSYGQVSELFTLSIADAGVPPTFTDETLAAPTQGSAYSDAVVATGDPTIVYTSDTLPAGLALDPATGAVTGTPTTPGAFSVVITATNEFGDDSFTWAGSVAAKPELALELAFAPGTRVGDASTEISASGLQVGSTYTLDLHSDPIRLYTGTIDASGGFTHVVTLPANTPVGAHMLVLTGVAPDGTVMTARAWFTLLPNGTIGAISYAGPLQFALAAAGTDSLLPLGAGVAFLLGGILLLRRRRQSAQPGLQQP